MNYKFFITKGHLQIFKKHIYEMSYSFIIHDSDNYKHSYGNVNTIFIVNNAIAINKQQ